VINWPNVQRRLGLSADGIPGRDTFAALFKVVGPSAKPEVLRSLGVAATVHFPLYGISATVDRLADFVAQTANETGGFRVFEENLNYSAEALVRTWPSRFTPASAAQYARKPELIAAKVYGDRMGNLRPEEGWLFRGRGMLQLTGRANYEAANKRLGLGLDIDPEIAAVPALSLLIACDFYKVNGVLGALDAGDTTKARRITNGGSIGLDHVNALRAQVMKVLA
jgi:putative chitinase